MKSLGIIGGFGPETTANFQMEIVKLFRKENPDKRPEIICWNAPVTAQMEQKLILEGKGIEDFLPLITKGAKLLEKAGADILVLPCNTLHIFIDRIENAVNIPILNILDVTTRTLVDNEIKNTAVFGTEFTVKSRLFTDKLNKNGVNVILPSQRGQQAINRVIFDILNIKSHRKSTRILHAVSHECIRNGTDSILLACTDLNIVFPNKLLVPVFDTMHILAQKSIETMLN